MATQPCAPAQGRSSSSKPSGAAHRMHTGGRGGRGVFKVTNKKHVVSEQIQPPHHPPPPRARSLAYFFQQGNKQKGAVAEGLVGSSAS